MLPQPGEHQLPGRLVFQVLSSFASLDRMRPATGQGELRDTGPAEAAQEVAVPPAQWVAGRVAMLPSRRVDPTHSRWASEPPGQGVAMLHGGRDIQVSSFPPAQPQRCCCCGLNTCLQLSSAPTFPKPRQLCWVPATNWMWELMSVNNPAQMCTLPRHVPNLQSGSWGHTCPPAQEMGYNVCTRSTACENVRTDGLRIGGARKQHAYVRAVVFIFACLCMCVCIHTREQGWCSRSWPGRSGSAGPRIRCMAALVQAQSAACLHAQLRCGAAVITVLRLPAAAVPAELGHPATVKSQSYRCC